MHTTLTQPIDFLLSKEGSLETQEKQYTCSEPWGHHVLSLFGVARFTPDPMLSLTQRHGGCRPPGPLSRFCLTQGLQKSALHKDSIIMHLPNSLSIL